MESVAPPRAIQRVVTVLENVQVARDTYRLRLDAPEIAATIVPGQFVMVRPGTSTAPLLGRPFALYDVARDAEGDPSAIDLVYLVIGQGTRALAERRAGDRLSVWGPLGNGFGTSPGGDVVFVAGGIGQTPFLALARWWLGQAEYAGRAGGAEFVRSSRLLYGVRTAALAAGLSDFQDAGVEVELATDDGSTGHHGYVTELLARRLERGERPSRVIGCGPPGMLRALTGLVDRFGIDCELSLENHMACGFGVCFSCVAPILQPSGEVDLRRVCVEGPVFPARVVVWEPRP